MKSVHHEPPPKLRRASAKRMSELRTSGDLKAVAAALATGEITERQAKNAAKFIRAGLAIRRNPVRTLLIGDSGEGPWHGEIKPLADGKWLARRYGPEYRNGGVVFADADAAEQYVRDAVDALPSSGGEPH